MTNPPKLTKSATERGYHTLPALRSAGRCQGFIKTNNVLRSSGNQKKHEKHQAIHSNCHWLPKWLILGVKTLQSPNPRVFNANKDAGFTLLERISSNHARTSGHGVTSCLRASNWSSETVRQLSVSKRLERIPQTKNKTKNVKPIVMAAILGYTHI